MSDARTLTRRDWALLIFASLVLFLPGFATLPPTDRDESRYVVTSQRMADTGDIVDLRYQDQPRYLQPAGIYWLQAAAATAFDSPSHDSIWAYRIPSLLGALLAVAMTAWLGARLFGRMAGLVAAALLAACFSLNFEARIAKIDAALLASICAAQLALARAYLEPAVKRWAAALFWAAIGVGVMLKGPLILIVTGSTILALVMWDRKVAWLKNLQPSWGPLLALAIALPWFIAIGILTDGSFYEHALMRNFLGKVGTGEQGHSGPAGYHLALFLIAFWPGSLLVLRAAGFVWRERRTAAVRLLICWVAPTWIVFEFVATKLPHYVLPTYPALAMLAGAALFDLKETPASRVRSVVFAFVCVLWLAASGLVAAAGPALIWFTTQTLNPIAAALGAASFVAACLGLWFLSQKHAGNAVGAMVLSAAFAWGGLFGVAPLDAGALWMSPRIVAAVRAVRPCAESVLVTTPYNEPSLIFLYGRERTRITPEGAAAADAFASTARCGVALIGPEDRAAFVSRAAALGVNVRAVKSIAGRNYSNGDELELTLYTAVRP